MTKLKIILDKEKTNFDSIEITINNLPVNFQLNDNTIIINDSIPFGIHKLRITPFGKNDCRMSITSVFINGDDIRQTIYLSYVNDNGTKVQPVTELWKSGLTWVLPFGNPLSMWFSQTSNKIKNNLYGTNLYEDYVIYYPESILIDDHHSPVIKDYFKYDFDFTIFKKNELHIKNVPFQFVDLKMDDNLFENCKQEILNNIDFLLSPIDYWWTKNQDTYKNNYDRSGWTRFPLIDYGNYTDVSKSLIHTKKLLESLDIKNIKFAGIAITKTNVAVRPHNDDAIQNTDVSDTVQLQFGITKNPGAKLKVAGIGLIPLDERPFIFNNDIYNHSLVNDDENIRIRILIKIDAESNKHLFDLRQMLPS